MPWPSRGIRLRDPELRLRLEEPRWQGGPCRPCCLQGTSPSLNRFSVFQCGVSVSNANMGGTSRGGPKHRPWAPKGSEASAGAPRSHCPRRQPGRPGHAFCGPLRASDSGWQGCRGRGRVSWPAGCRTPQWPCPILLLLRGRLGRRPSSPALRLAEQTDRSPAGP